MPKIAVISQLRGLAIVAILFYHYVLEISHFSIRPQLGDFQQNISGWIIVPTANKSALIINGLTGLNSFGWEFVGVFLLLSGFGLTYSRLKNPSSGNFLLKRLKRLIPLWQFGILFALLVNFISLNYFKMYLSSIPTLDLGYYFRLLLFPIFVDFNFRYLASVNPSLWFMSLLFQFYIIFDVLYLMMEKLKIKRFLIFSLIVTILYRAVIIYFFNQEPNSEANVAGRSIDLFSTAPARLFEFTAGMGIAYAYHFKNLILDKISHFKALGFLTLWVFGNVLTWSVLGWVFSDIILTISLTFISCYILSKFVPEILKTNLTYLGDNSFFIYLFHNQYITQLLIPILMILTQNLAPLVVFYLLGFMLIYLSAFYGSKLYVKISSIRVTKLRV